MSEKDHEENEYAGNVSLRHAWHYVYGASEEELEEAKKLSLERYGDIISLPHPVSRTHPPASWQARAAQFAPYATLRGFGSRLRGTAQENEEAMNDPHYVADPDAPDEDVLRWSLEEMPDAEGSR